MALDMEKMLCDFQDSDCFDLDGIGIADGIVNLKDPNELNPAIDTLRSALKIYQTENIIMLLDYFDKLDGEADGMIDLDKLADFIDDLNSVPEVKKSFCTYIEQKIGELQNLINSFGQSEKPDVLKAKKDKEQQLTELRVMVSKLR